MYRNVVDKVLIKEEKIKSEIEFKENNEDIPIDDNRIVRNKNINNNIFRKSSIISYGNPKQVKFKSESSKGVIDLNNLPKSSKGVLELNNSAKKSTGSKEFKIGTFEKKSQMDFSNSFGSVKKNK